jgi:hypothetical protein
LYSKYNKVALVKAIAECPEGKLKLSDKSGRVLLAIRFAISTKTTEAVFAAIIFTVWFL